MKTDPPCDTVHCLPKILPESKCLAEYFRERKMIEVFMPIWDPKLQTSDSSLVKMFGVIQQF